MPTAHGMRKSRIGFLIEDLMGGTYGMRRKHRRYLPQEPRELDESLRQPPSPQRCSTLLPAA
jgi:hypothetical protein